MSTIKEDGKFAGDAESSVKKEQEEVVVPKSGKITFICPSNPGLRLQIDRPRCPLTVWGFTKGQLVLDEDDASYFREHILGNKDSTLSQIITEVDLAEGERIARQHKAMVDDLIVKGGTTAQAIREIQAGQQLDAEAQMRAAGLKESEIEKARAGLAAEGLTVTASTGITEKPHFNFGKKAE